MCSLPLLGERVALQAAKRTALVTVDQAADGLIEGHLAVFDKRVPGTGARAGTRGAGRYFDAKHPLRIFLQGGSWRESSDELGDDLALGFLRSFQNLELIGR